MSDYCQVPLFKSKIIYRLPELGGLRKSNQPTKTDLRNTNRLTISVLGAPHRIKTTKPTKTNREKKGNLMLTEAAGFT